ncbi:CLUMA_CG004097, isoform A [Clunio marinus]|uniref:CLUMA_CG004097, isoform A n=1 Tax=Clunio marinus TaxID=568069 RepID=A0A1J1HQP8_9DIPT|nr:CLUMA_CG004097, isoform A [Clunio marinus]
MCSLFVDISYLKLYNVSESLLTLDDDDDEAYESSFNRIENVLLTDRNCRIILHIAIEMLQCQTKLTTTFQLDCQI